MIYLIIGIIIGYLIRWYIDRRLFLKIGEEVKKAQEALKILEGNKRRKIIAIHSGGDWSDASVDYLVLRTDIEPEKLKLLYPGYQKFGISLEAWLITEGHAVYANDDEIEVLWDD